MTHKLGEVAQLPFYRHPDVVHGQFFHHNDAWEVVCRPDAVDAEQPLGKNKERVGAIAVVGNRIGRKGAWRQAPPSQLIRFSAVDGEGLTGIGHSACAQCESAAVLEGPA